MAFQCPSTPPDSIDEQIATELLQVRALRRRLERDRRVPPETLLTVMLLDDRLTAILAAQHAAAEAFTRLRRSVDEAAQSRRPQRPPRSRKNPLMTVLDGGAAG